MYYEKKNLENEAPIRKLNLKNFAEKGFVFRGDRDSTSGDKVPGKNFCSMAIEIMITGFCPRCGFSTAE